MITAIRHLVDQYGAVGLFAWVGLETAGIPVAGSDFAILAAAALAPDFATAALYGAVAFTAVVFGGNVGWAGGRLVGTGPLHRFGRYFFLPANRINALEEMFARHAGKTVFIARWVAFLRVVAAPLAGATRMPFRRFNLLNAAGGAVWVIALTIAGHLAGRSFAILERSLGIGAVIALMSLIAVAVLAHLRHRWRRRSSSPAGAASESRAGPQP